MTPAQLAAELEALAKAVKEARHSINTLTSETDGDIRSAAAACFTAENQLHLALVKNLPAIIAALGRVEMGAALSGDAS